MPDQLMFVQFPHPGPEHVPAGPAMAWNRRDHARKFLRAEAEYLLDGRVERGRIALWGEWEPQSRVVGEFLDAPPGFPRWLHDPYWEIPRHKLGLQNTDPLVFGDHFLYTNCRQARNRKLRELAPGSLIVFGSKFGGEFVLDTVLVVGEARERFTRSTTRHITADEWVHAVVLDPLARSKDRQDDEFRFYRGARYQGTSDVPFSFVPCRPYRADGWAFPRPVLRLPTGWISQGLAMGARAIPTTSAEVRELWAEIVSQVLAAGLALGIRLEPPQQVQAND
jgi:hypothetical protein